MLFSAELSPRCHPTEIPEHARALEECGLYRVWVRDMLVAPWELWSAATAVALSTKSVRIGVDVTNPYTRSPVVTAHAAATVDNLSGGRLDLGLGQGIARFLKMMGLKPANHALEEVIPIIRDLLSGKRVDQQGAYFSIRGAQLPVKAVQERLPIWMAAMEEENFRMAGRLADGLLTISARRPFLEKALGWLDKPIPVATWLPYSSSREELASYLDDLLPRLSDEALEAMGVQKELVSRKEVLDSFAVCGPQDLRRKGERLGAIGVSEIILEYFALEDLRSLRGVLVN
ncbi:MAG: LLM class flavin-dependent oxidoreductase [Dehalococcoidia bacterium]|nr:LLM class flavin-dependent oxidoreductase [Dehalococcoidia bacterium]